jgi:hypothetical protein
MESGLRFPAEDEFALGTISARSPLMSQVFPRRAEHYARYGTLGDVPEAEVAEWQAAILGFVKKLACKNGKPLVLESPFHTGRIRLLLRIFPEAKFVHIHRDPYSVFQSTCHTMRVAMRYCTLQRHALDVEEQTIRRYREVVDAFLAEKDLIPMGRFHKPQCEDLERDPIGQMRATYEALELRDFGEIEPSVRRYVASLEGDQRMVHPTKAYFDSCIARILSLKNSWSRNP